MLIDTGATVTVHTGNKAPRLTDKVSADWDLNGLLNGIYIAEDLNEALTLRGQLSAEESVITRSGVWLGAQWLRIARDTDASAGVIARRQELEELEQEISQLETAVADLDRQRDEGREALKQLEQEREQKRRESDEQNRQAGELRSQLSAKRARVEQLTVRRERADTELRDADAQMRQGSEQLAEARMILSEAIELMEQDTDQRESLLQQRDTIRANLDEVRQRARHDKDKAHELAMRHQSLKTQLDAIRQGITRLHEQDQRLRERHELHLESLGESSDPMAEHAVEQELRSAEQARSRAEQEVQAVRSHLEQERLAAQTFDVQRAGLAQQLEEDEFDLEELLAALPEDAELGPMEAELANIAARIARLGPINLAAIDEYKVESERKQYLDAQDADLNEALQTLDNAIKRIDRETRTRFKETFDTVNQSLQELFPKVFGGGHAYLELTGDDLLDTGIAIMARPPGKRNSTIHLLSGGEKALTAIALVFSIFRLNPAPFCMLDEVDAPLDDANVGRYARLVQEMSEQVQFIYITHNKIAMEMAHQLMGVTMHEPGVSRLVTVDVDEAAELAAV